MNDLSPSSAETNATPEQHSVDVAIHAEAERRVSERIEFFKHLAAYLGVNTGLLAINHFLTPEKLWFFWVLGGWGLGILLHAFLIFGPRGSGNWRRKMIEAEEEKLRHSLHPTHNRESLPPA